MSESRGHTNGEEKSAGGARFPQQLGEAGRQIRGDAQNLVTHVSEAGNELQTYVADMARDRPLGILAVAAGIGYVLGGGLSSRLSVLALGVGTRFAMALAAREMGSWATQAAGQSRSSDRQRDQRDQKENRGAKPESGGLPQTHH